MQKAVVASARRVGEESDGLKRGIAATAVALLGKPEARAWAFAAAFGVPFAAAQVTGWFVEHGGTFARIDPAQAAACTAAFFALSALTVCLCAAVLARVFRLRRFALDDGSFRSARRRRLPRPLAALARCLRRLLDRPHAWPLVWCAILVCWLPAYAAFFPGVFAYDPLYEVKWLLSDGVTTAFHTLAHSYWLTGSVAAGKAVFGSYEAGLALYTTVQCLLLSGVLSYCVCALRRLGAPFWSQVLALAWFALFPAHAVLAVTATKDVAFAAFFLLVVVFSFEALRDPRAFFSRWSGPARLIAAVLLMFAFRKNGIYAFAVAAPLLVAGCVGARGRAALLCVACLLAGAVYFGPVHDAVCTEDAPSVPASGKVEALSVPMQQLARVMVEGEGLSDSTRQAIEGYLPSWSAYNERIVDPLKFGGSKNEAIEEDPLGFITLWAQTGAAHPATYLDAWLAMSYGYGYVGFRFSCFLEGYPYLDWQSVPQGAIADADAEAFVHIEQQGAPALAAAAGWLMRRMPWEAMPVLSWLFSPGLMMWILAFSSMACLYLRRFRAAAALAMPVVYGLTCLLGPTMLIRYAYPFFALMPLAIALPFLPPSPKRACAEKKEVDR